MPKHIVSVAVRSHICRFYCVLHKSNQGHRFFYRFFFSLVDRRYACLRRICPFVTQILECEINNKIHMFFNWNIFTGKWWTSLEKKRFFPFVYFYNSMNFILAIELALQELTRIENRFQSWVVLGLSFAIRTTFGACNHHDASHIFMGSNLFFATRKKYDKALIVPINLLDCIFCE